MFFSKKPNNWKLDLIKKSIFFDGNIYRESANISGKQDPAEHYLNNWNIKPINPSFFFDSNFYLRTYEDVKIKGINPLLHYIMHGWKEARIPSPSFDREAFLAAHPHIDPEATDPAACCIMLYGEYNWRGKTLHNVQQVPKTIGSQIAVDALIASQSSLESIPASGSITDTAASSSGNPVDELCRREFDVDYYLSSYPDVKESGLDPFLHYMDHGYKEGRNPNSEFDSTYYKNTHLGRGSKQNPLIHYVRQGKKKDLATKPASSEELCRLEFDEKFYLSMYPDVKESGISPFLHYMNFGFKENRNPNPNFDSFYYKTHNIKENQEQNPLLHYIKFGRKKNVLTRPASAITLYPTFKESPETSVCVHIHCYYPELLGEVTKGLKNFPRNTHVVVTVCTEADRIFCTNYLNRHLPELTKDILIVPNQGRDIAPFFVGSAHVWKNYDIVLHLHTKQSRHISWGNIWRRYIFDQTMGSKELINAIIDQFTIDEKIGALYPENFYEVKKFTVSNPNTENVKNVLRFLGISEDHISTEFAAGSMCWFRTQSLLPLIEKINSLELFEAEEGQVDNTLAHALERVAPMTVRAGGFSVHSYTPPSRALLGDPLPGPGRDVTSSEVTDAWPRDTARAAARPPLPLAPVSRVFNGKSLDIHWVLPSFGKGAGGHTTIFRMVRFLEQFGHQQTIWLQNATNMPSEEVARQRIIDWYMPVGKNVAVLFLPDDVRQLSGDAIIATDCWTAFPVSRATKFKERFYFVQDFEPDFHPAGANRLVAESTYDFGFSALCAGAWLDKIMKDRGVWSRRWDLAADHDIYFPLTTTGPVIYGPEQEVQIAFYARPYTPRRAVELGFAALEQLHRSGRRFKAHLFGEEKIEVNYDFPYEQHGIMSHDQLAELYRAMDVGLVFSATNYSLIPLEMMACGLPVVELDVPSTRAIFHNEEVAFAPPSPHGIANTINDLLNSPAKREIQRKNGIAFVTGSSWKKSAQKIESAIKEKLIESNYEDISTAVRTPFILKNPRVSVFIPTYNAGNQFQNVLDAVVNQECDFPYDVLVIDSSSTDNTADIVSKYKNKNVRFSQIPQSEFQHGRTRNLGISMTDGDYVAILTQDATPANKHWLSALINGFSLGDRVAGVTGRHAAYPEHGAFVEREIREQFDNLALLPSVIDTEVGLPSYCYRGSITWRMLAYFYSDNNSAISRKVWEKLPYPEIEWGEDYVWASLAIKSGYQKAYADNAVVLHSHNLPDQAQFKTATAEGKFWAKEFGIRLHKNEEEIIAHMNARDNHFARENGISNSELKQRLKSNKLLVSGRIQGWEDSRSEI
ncbi:rhamnan synthesis F family protein [Burkholderia pseudomultivorans]|uniref:rhamnosyltransferase WsaF family glycosyltransferase n=1 Tax=Burkholderia pseudomultivorans TaxID=1207504 RepID=UPI0009BD77D8|nr:rhamnan synthesis F family protein [Burkholderia pseudomultivorans]